MLPDTERDIVPHLGSKMSSRELSAIMQRLSETPNVERSGEDTYFDYQRSGVSLSFGADERLEAVHLHGHGHEAFTQSVVEPPAGVRWGMTRSDVLRLLGSPSASGGGEQLQALGKVPAWDRYRLRLCSMHVQYEARSEKIELVTLMRHDVVPRGPTRGPDPE